MGNDIKVFSNSVYRLYWNFKFDLNCLIYNRIVLDVLVDNLIVDVLNLTFVSQARSWWKIHPRVWCLFLIASAYAHTHTHTIYITMLLLYIYIFKEIYAVFYFNICMCIILESYPPFRSYLITWLSPRCGVGGAWKFAMTFWDSMGGPSRAGGLIKTKPMGWKLKRWTKVRCSPWML